MTTATAITDMTATPTTFHAFESSELETADVVVVVLVAAGVGVGALVVEDVDCTSEVEVRLVIACEADVLVLVLDSTVEKSPLSPISPPALVLCDSESVVLVVCDVSDDPDGSRPSRAGRESLFTPGFLEKVIASTACRSVATSTSLSFIVEETEY